jgi:hypothetical protein
LLVVPVLPITGGVVVVQMQGAALPKGAASFAPLTATTATAGAGVCATTETGSVPFAANNARGAAAIVEPRTCASGTRLVFLPAVRFTDALPAAAGHVLTARLDGVVVNGTVAILRNVQFYVQSVGGGNPIVTATHVTILRGTLRTVSSSTATLAVPTTYGIGVRMQLTRPAVSSTAQVALLVYLVDHDGGVTNVVAEQWVSFTFTY